MTEPYQRPFARYYDLVYSDKDYDGECDLIERIFRRYAATPPETILDAGCGSGSHAIRLAQRGYKLCGVDRSEGLLELAREKAGLTGARIEFHRAELEAFELSRRFDACISMFAVLSFQLSNNAFQRVLRQIRRHLVPGGLLIADVWYGPAILVKQPSNRLKIVAKPGLRLLRFAVPSLQVQEHTVTTEHRLLVMNDAEPRLIEEVVETQVVRYFFPQELDFHLEMAGFTVLRLFAFPQLDTDASEEHWELGLIARVAG